MESLRALAALSVVAVHVFIGAQAQDSLSEPVEKLFMGGGYGVFFFMVLSGYLLFRPFVRHLVDGTSKLSLRDYGVNRVLRILPLYYVVVAVVLITETNGGEPQDWWKFGLFLENFFSDTVLRADSPMWSLAVEIQFYAILPLVALLGGRLSGGSRTRAAMVILALGLFSLGLRFGLVTFADEPSFRWALSLPTLFFFFAIGMLLSLLRMSWDDRQPERLRGPAGTADLWILASAPIWAIAIWWPKSEAVVALAAFLVIAGAVLPLRQGLLTRALDWRPLAVLGVASYSLYLWHAPLIGWLSGSDVSFATGVPIVEGDKFGVLELGVAVVPACILVALASYALVESPFLRLRRRWAERTGKS